MTETEKSPQGNSSTKPAKAYSCIRCFERKVKCDRESPCSNCRKSNAECIFRVPPPPRRRKKRTQEEILKARLSHYEEILRLRGIDIHKDNIKAEDLPDPSEEVATAGNAEGDSDEVNPPVMRAADGPLPFVHPKLIVDEGRTRFIENSLWTSMADEFSKPSEAMVETSDEDSEADDNIDFVLGATPSSTGVRNLHPLPEQIFAIWQIFLENVNPLSKLVHVPSLEPQIIEASSHLDTLPKNLEALLFAIYTLSVLSLSAQDCESMLGESRSTLISRYRSGTKRALTRARFLGTSDLMTLQAFTLHLLAMRDAYDSRTLWTLSGVATRIGDGMGVHRDGASLGLGPFETELRRRLWWQLTFLDFRTAELAGSGQDGNVGKWNVRVPSNIDDADIWPGMKDPPESKERGTEMIFCLTRYELGNFWKQKLLTKNPNGDFRTLWDNFRSQSTMEEKEKAIEELEKTLEHKYVRFCDPSVPVEFMAILVTRAATNGMRLMAHHPRRYSNDTEVPESERRLLWSIGSKLMEIDNLLHSSKPMHRFLWHTNNYFQWQALIYMLTELKRTPLLEHVDRGWQLINEVFENHSEFVKETRKPIHYAIGSLCLKAWSAREETWSQRSFAMPLRTPKYIDQLRKDRNKSGKKSTVQAPKLEADYFGFSQHTSFTSPSSMYTGTTQNSEPTPQTMPTATYPAQDTRHEQSMQPQFDFSQPLQQPQQMTHIPRHTPEQSLQSFFWLDSTAVNVQAPPPPGLSFDSLGFSENNLDPMDWTQWDFLLKDVRQTG